MRSPSSEPYWQQTHATPPVACVALGQSDYNENFIQDIAFDHPRCLPIAEIDRSYEGLVPICKELYTPAGYLDGLYITPTGRLVILEAKLWRNPEARRKVVAQILDYAKELSLWGDEDLQREVVVWGSVAWNTAGSACASC